MAQSLTIMTNGIYTNQNLKTRAEKALKYEGDINPIGSPGDSPQVPRK